MKILLTGINGFIGNYVALGLKEDHKIVGIGRQHECNVDKIEYINQDLNDEEFVNDIVEKVNSTDVIIHVAALKDYNDFNENLISTNIHGTLKINKLAVKLNAKKIIHTSGIPVIGMPNDQPIKENSLPEPETLYHITKLTSEYILGLSSNHNINVVNFRIPSPIGVGMDSQTILPMFLDKCKNDEDIYIYGKGTRRQNYIDVRDIALAIKVTLNKNISGTFNLGSKTTISNKELASICKDITKSRSSIKFSDKDDPHDNYNWDISLDKTEELLGFTPQYEVTDTIKWISGL